MISSADSLAVRCCTICGSPQTYVAWPIRFNADGYFDDSFAVVRCRQCGAGSTQPSPPPEQLAAYYHRGVYGKGGGRGNWMIDVALSTLCDQRLREIERFRRPPQPLLDVGCGKGRFLYRAARRGWQAEGTDFAEGQAVYARQHYGVQVTQGELRAIGFEASSFGAVSAWHVVEHLDDPHTFVAEVARILQPRGIFACEVPNVASLQAVIAQNRWFHLDIPRHLLHFTPDAMQYLLRREGFHVLRLQTFSFEMGPFGMLQSLLNVAGLPPNWLFRWLKRSIAAPQRAEVVVNLAAAAALAIPSALIDVAAAGFRRGGVIRTIAAKL